MPVVNRKTGAEDGHAHVGDRDLKENLQLHSDNRWDFLKITVVSANDWMEMLIWAAKREKPCEVFGQKVVPNPAKGGFSMFPCFDITNWKYVLFMSINPRKQGSLIGM